jgi:8-oxo-(d)GTP phosphatase
MGERRGERPPPDAIRAAGAVLWRAGPAPGEPGGPAVQVALVHRARHDDWSFPKGKARPGEHTLLCAVREVTEETGLTPVLGRPLQPVLYQVDGRVKRVEYWSATPAADGWGRRTLNGRAVPGSPGVRGDQGGGPPGPVPGSPGVRRDRVGRSLGLAPYGGGAGPGAHVGFAAGPEVDRLEWLPVADAAARLSYQDDADVLREFADGPVATIPFIFLRHASAGDKRGWQGDDLLRPLDALGRAAAGQLAGLLACFGPARVFSSAAARCVETVLPYAALTGAPVTTEPTLTAGAGGGRDAAAAWVCEVLASGEPTILCMHGELVPPLLGQVLGHLGAGRHGGGPLPKAAFTVLHLAGPAGRASLAGIEEHRIP